MSESKGEAIKAKGDELIQKFKQFARGEKFSVIEKRATQCAIIAVEEIIKVVPDRPDCPYNFYVEVLNYLKSKL